ncbi:MAG: tripartite tricarboxylate transporter substrate binding protein [Pseudomonadota bacterium]|nr:tripartite tricarboxylate transporter substrate binding protein [Pseudomonadota bacterium]
MDDHRVKKVRQLLKVLAACALSVMATVASAQAYPNRPIRLVLGYAAGGVADITARLVAQKLSASLGQQVIVDNKPSAGGIVAAETVAKAEPDGYTLLHMNYGNAVSAAVFRKLPYDIKRDFQPVSAMGFFDVAMLTDKGSEIRSVQDFIAKARAAPEKYNIGTVSIGSGQHMAAVLFNSIVGVQSTIIPYKTTPALLLALKTRDIAVAFEILSPALPLLRSGEIKALAVSSANRFAGLPDVPSLQEAGVKGYDVTAWNGLAAPANTPRPIVDRLNREINAALALPDVQSKFHELGIDPRGGSPEELRTLLSNEIEKWKNLVSSMKMERL